MTQSTTEKAASNNRLSMPVQYLKGVGPARARTFARLGVHTVGDLLEYYPRDWAFAPDAIKIRQIRPNQEATIVALVESTDYQTFRRQPIFEAMLSDETGVCRIVWFHGGFLRNQLRPGQVIMASGKVGVYKHQLQMTNPKFLVLDKQSPKPDEYFGGGVYPASARLSSMQIKRIIRPVLDNIDELVDEFYDEKFLKRNTLISRKEAFLLIHFAVRRRETCPRKTTTKIRRAFSDATWIGTSSVQRHASFVSGADELRQ
jgi:ATP-dependent DNA helicase RecG